MLEARVEHVRIRWVEDEHEDPPDWLFMTAHDYYGENGKGWDHVPEEEKAKTIEEHGSLWNACLYYEQQDAERLEAYHQGDWWMVGCMVEILIKVYLDFGAICVASQPFGDSLWGIESDVDPSYRKEIEQDCLANAIYEADKAGFSARMIYEHLGQEPPAEDRPKPVPPRPANLVRRFVPEDEEAVPA